MCYKSPDILASPSLYCPGGRILQDQSKFLVLNNTVSSAPQVQVSTLTFSTLCFYGPHCQPCLLPSADTPAALPQMPGSGKSSCPFVSGLPVYSPFHWNWAQMLCCLSLSPLILSAIFFGVHVGGHLP